MTSDNHTRGVSNLLFWYIVLTIAGVTYIILNLSYHSKYSEFDHVGYSLQGNDTILIEEHGALVEVSASAAAPYYLFIVFVITAPDHVTHRDTIRRKSWAGYRWRDEDDVELTDWRYFFVVGRTESMETMTSLEREIAEYRDMIMADELDSYHNLVLKVLWLLKHAVQNYNFSYLVKTDDDSFINIALLHKYLHAQLNSAEGPYFFGGARTARQPVLRRGRYGVSRDLWGPDYYAPYCSGSGYVLSYEAAGALDRVWETGVQPLFYVEDAFMGALAYHSDSKISVTNIRGFYWHFKYGCSNKNALLMHYVKLDNMEAFMEKYKLGQSYC